MSSPLAHAFDLQLDLPGGMKVDTENLRNFGKKEKKSPDSFEAITPEQEYYIGRSIAAVILSRYPVLKHDRSRQYVNVMGNVLAQASDRPITFNGYRFLILDTDEINALSAPGGFIFITKGLLKCCKTESALASVLAHEIGHIQRKHALQAITKAHIAASFKTLAIPGTSTFSNGSLSDLATTLDKTVADITAVLIDKGYSRKFEDDADKDAVTILQRVGYDPNGFIDMLHLMKQQLKPDGRGFAKTHPSPDERIELLTGLIGTYKKPTTPAARKFRFMAMTGGI